MDPTTMGATMVPPEGLPDAPANMRTPMYGETGRCNTNKCGCDLGFEGLYCNDIDECAVNADNCDRNAACINTAGSFTCVCNDGYTGDGTLCCDIGYESTTNADGVAVCTDIDGCGGVDCGAGATCTDIAAPGAGYTCTPSPPGAQPTNANATPANNRNAKLAPSTAPAPEQGLSAGGVVLACAISTGVTVAGLWAWSRHVASRHVRTRLDTRLADFEHDPEHMSVSPGVGVIPRGTVWAAISRLTKTWSSASAASPAASRECPDDQSCGSSPALSSTSSNVDTV